MALRVRLGVKSPFHRNAKCFRRGFMGLVPLENIPALAAFYEAIAEQNDVTETGFGVHGGIVPVETMQHLARWPGPGL
jgi:hypothetical protein